MTRLGLLLFALLGSSDPDLDRLATWMSGRFSSAAQAETDPEYLDVRLTVTPIWTDRSDGRWLYVEQALGASLDRPYRQRVYRVVRGEDGSLESRVYLLPDPAAYVGAGADPSRFAALSRERLVPRNGCTVVLRPDGPDAFAGSTTGRACPSELRGAAYATSEVRVTADALRSWDRGFDAEGKQVWGAEKGPYLFLRVAP
jgi:hypothetical protein